MIYNCILCKLTFARRHGLVRHYNSNKHKQKEKEFLLIIFSSKIVNIIDKYKFIENHMTYYKCLLCNKIYNRYL